VTFALVKVSMSLMSHGVGVVAAVAWAWSPCLGRGRGALPLPLPLATWMGGRVEEREERASPRASFPPASAEPLIGPSSFRLARSSSAAHSLPSEVRQLNDILLIPRGAAVLSFFRGKRRDGDRNEDGATNFLTDSVDAPGETPHNPQGTPHEPQAGSHVPQD
jgi:hypothetical protein